MMKRFKNILYFNDGAMDSCPALERAVNLARTNRARLTVIDVLGETETPELIENQFGMDLNQILRERRQEILEELIAPFNKANTLIYTQVLTGIPFVEVIRAVLRNGYDLVIKEAAQPLQGLSERLLGSTDMHLLRKCPCPVWIDRPGASPYQTVLAAVDPVGEEGKGCARLVMDLASSLAQRESALLAVVHAWRMEGESMLRNGLARISALELDQLLEQTGQRHQARLKDLLNAYGMSSDDPDVHLVKGEPVSIILNLSEQLPVDLIVMGTVGRTGIPGFFIGNTAEEVLQTTQASILAVKPEGFVSPVRSK